MIPSPHHALYCIIDFRFSADLVNPPFNRYSAAFELLKIGSRDREKKERRSIEMEDMQGASAVRTSSLASDHVA